VSTTIRATILFSIILIGAAIAFIGGTGGGVRAMEAGNTGSAHHASVLADGEGPGPGVGLTGFTWGFGWP
jgi:hypothetical protein